MTFVNESCFATVPSCTVSGFLSGIHPVMTFALKKQSGFAAALSCAVNRRDSFPSRRTALVMTFASESGFATMLWSKHFATQNGLLSKFCYAKPPTASAVFAVFDRPVFLRGAYFAVYKRFNLNFIKLFRRNSFGKYN